MNSTIARNSVGNGASGGGGAFPLHNGTNGANGTGAGIDSTSTTAPTALTADLIAGGASNSHGKDCAISSTIKGQGYNIASDSSCDFPASSASEISAYANALGALADNGGPTLTMKPETASSGTHITHTNPAINYIPVSSGVCPLTDQRGYVPFTDSTHCYVGAYQGGYPNFRLPPPKQG